ncbi:hypothetical protein ONZ45_g2033 [Pleurotus djamor]|nr:hypothetical protein ONZ45_g2033 [Pleurotus djamor]
MPSLFSSLWPSTPTQAVELSDDSTEGLLPGNGSNEDVEGRCELRIEGMTCSACVESIEGMLRQQEGIHSIKVALLAERGVVEYDPSRWDADKIISEISDIGFDATLIPPTRSDTITLRVYGMTCSACTSTVENTLSAVPGISSVSVSLTTSTATIVFDRALIGPREMVERVEDMGFDAMLSDDNDGTQIQSLTRAKEVMEWRNRLVWSAVFAAPVFFLSMMAMHIHFLDPLTHARVFQGRALFVLDVVVLILTTPAQFWVGSKFYRNAYKSLKHGSATMDVLVMLGTSAAYFYSLFTLVAGFFNTTPDFRPFLFFDTSTMLIFFVCLGRYLENRAKGKTSAALTDLMALAPSMATIYTDAPACTTEKKIPTELVQVGDVVKLVPGDKIPADGTVLKGSSTVDESAVTGEAVPVLKQAGDAVIGGTINGLGTFDMTVTRAGKDTALSQIVRLVEEAQTSKAPIQAFADRVAGYFVPTVISLAFLTFIVWMIVSNVVSEESLPMMFHKHGASRFAVCLQMCISVVVVACPCALGLSTPTAIMVGTGIGATNGILIKGGKALEASKDIKRIVFDKTGTVTVGKLSVVGLSWIGSNGTHADNSELYAGDSTLHGLCADGKTEKSMVLAMLSATEARSEHPLAKAIATYGKELLQGNKSVPENNIEQFESITGAGVKATISYTDGLKGKKRQELRVGSARFVTQTDDGHLPASFVAFEEQETALGRSIIYVSLSSVLVLAVSLSDAPKPSSKHAIQALEDMGIEVFMMTGDGRATALAVAKQVGIRPENVMAGISPGGKATKIKEMVKSGAGGVAMVGDGINDSPALAAATVGIALSSGTSVAVEAAEIVLMRSDLLDVVAALHLSRSIFRTIRRNLLWACIYNVLSIPLAMGFFLPLGLYLHPMMAGAAMAFSSVSVVTSSLLLKWWVRPKDSVMPDEKLDPGSADTGLNWSGMFVDTARSALVEVRDGLRGFMGDRGRGNDREGYVPLPVEMAATNRV